MPGDAFRVASVGEISHQDRGSGLRCGLGGGGRAFTVFLRQGEIESGGSLGPGGGDRPGGIAGPGGVPAFVPGDHHVQLLQGDRIFGTEPAAVTIHDPLPAGPEDRLRVPLPGEHIGEGRAARDSGLSHGTVENGDHHGPGQGGIRAEGGGGGALHQAHLPAPVCRLGVVGAGGHIGKRLCLEGEVRGRWERLPGGLGGAGAGE